MYKFEVFLNLLYFELIMFVFECMLLRVVGTVEKLVPIELLIVSLSILSQSY